MKNAVFWDMMPCSPVQIYLHFGESYCTHLHCILKTKAAGYSEGSLAPRLFNEEITSFSHLLSLELRDD
jgi:hypothetical protein